MSWRTQTLLLTAMLALAASPAYANPVIVPVSTSKPVFGLLLIPIILIETGLCCWIVRISFGKSIGMVTLANVLSALVGLPLGGAISLTVVGELGVMDRLAPWLAFMGFFFIAYWLAVLVEYGIARLVLPRECRGKAGQWSCLANAATYSLLLILWLSTGPALPGRLLTW